MPETTAKLSAEVTAADWIADRLSSLRSGVVTAVVPDGFESYARVLHPVEQPPPDGFSLVRWAQVAAWSGVALQQDSQFAEIAFPEDEPAEPEPWSGPGPELGELHVADLTRLSETLVEATSTPERCWLCVWEGYGSSSDGPRVRLPGRDYLLYVGPVRTAPTFTSVREVHLPNLWWPADRAWCVASEIDLPWTYVGGSSALITRLLQLPDLEAQPADRADNFHQRPPDWLREPIERAASELLERGQTTLRTWRGNVHMQLERPHGRDDGALRTQIEDPHTAKQTQSGWMRLRAQEPERLSATLRWSLVTAVIELTG